MEDFWLIPAMFLLSIFWFVVGGICVIDEDPQMLTNDCMIYNEVYYCPTEMPEGLVMPVE